MVEISNIKVYDLAESIVASGYAMGIDLDDFAGRAENIAYWLQKGDFFLDFVRHYNAQNKNIGKDTIDSCFKCGKPARQRVNTGNGGGHYYCSKHCHDLYRYGDIVEDEVYEFVDKDTVKVTIKGDQHKTSSFLISAVDVPLIFKKNKNTAKAGYVVCNGMLLHHLILDSLGIYNKMIDHINRDRADNRRENLRICNYQQNLRNKACKGVHFEEKRKKWRAYITVDGRQIDSCRFDSEHDAIKYRLELERKYFGEFAPNAHLFEEYGIPTILKSSLPISKYSLKDAVQDFNRVVRLVKVSSLTDNSHCNWLKGVRVSFDIKYPNYFSPELQRYHFVDIVCSSSKMHRLLKMDLDKACNKYVSEEIIENVERYIKDYNNILADENFVSLRYVFRDGTVIETTNKQDALYYAFMRVLSNCPQGIELFMRCSTNYMALRNIYHQRKRHYLREDWQEGFCKFIEGLPFFEEFINQK